MGGSMVSKRLSIFGFISAAALVSGVLVGCGGSSASTSGTVPTVTSTGGFVTTPGNSTTAAPTSTTPQQVQVTTGSGTGPAVVPPGQPSIDTSTTLCVIPSGQTILNGLAPGKFKKQAPGTPSGEIFISYDDVNWFDTTVQFKSDGTISESMAFASPASAFSPAVFIKVVGPLTLSGTGINGNALTIANEIEFGFIIFSDGSSSLPIKLALKLPANGGSTAGGNYANCTTTTDFATGVGVLKINWPGVSKTQTKTAVKGLLSFSDPLSDLNDQIPSSGINHVGFYFIGFTN